MLSLIVACGRGNVIGKQNSLPWHLPGDLQYFKCATLGKPIIMGRKTHDSIGRLLPGRPNIIVSRQPHWQPLEGGHKAADLARAEALAQQLAPGADEIMVIGGEQIYRQALPLAQRIYMTEVDIEVEGGDAFFPALNPEQWREVSRRQGEASAPAPYAYVILERVEKCRPDSGNL